MSRTSLTLVGLLSAPAADVIPGLGFFTTDWSNIGGWGVAAGLGLFFVIGAFREWWVPGARYRRLEESAKKNSEMLKTSVDTNYTLSMANDISKHFFESTVPKRGEPTNE